MDFLTATILSGIVYDLIKQSIAITADHLKQRLNDWIIDEVTALKLASGIQQIDNLEDMSEKAIAAKLQSNPEIESLLSNIKPAHNIQINQTHTGSGDNIGRDKIIHNG